MTISFCFLLFFTISPDSKSSNQPQKKFRYVSGDDTGESASYTFQSTEECVIKAYHGCIGCDPYEDRDILLWRQFMSQNDAEQILNGYGDADSNWKVEEN